MIRKPWEMLAVTAGLMLLKSHLEESPRLGWMLTDEGTCVTPEDLKVLEDRLRGDYMVHTLLDCAGHSEGEAFGAEEEGLWDDREALAEMGA